MRPTIVPPPTLLELVLNSASHVLVDGRSLTADQLAVTAGRMAAGLERRGVEPGSGVVVVDDASGHDLLAVMLGAWWLGARPAILPRSTNVARLRAAKRETGADVVVSASAPRELAVPFADLIGRTSAVMGEYPGCTGGDVALEIATSGTTGRPKFVSFTHEALAVNVADFARRLELAPADRLYSPLPLSLAGVIGMVLLPGLLAGATIRVGRLEGPEVRHASRDMRELSPTFVYGVPYVLDVVSRLGRASHLTDLRWLICSSAPLPRATFDRVSGYFGVPPRNSYCLAEAGTVTVNTATGDDELRATVGSPLDHMTVEFEASGDGRRRVVVSGRGCGLGYRRAGRIERFVGGRVLTNDYGSLDDGVLRLHGRADTVIQVAGQNVDIADIHDALAACPGIKDYSVVVGHDDALGQIPVLLVAEAGCRATAEEILDFCRTALPAAAVPRSVRFVDHITRSTAGKPILVQHDG